jgi:uncharacterized protein YndB with AHSA1/START domain
MKYNTGKLQVTLPGPCDILVTREFALPRQLLFDAHTKPAMVKEWLYGPEGWSMPVCEIDLRVGGKYRHVWRNATGVEFSASGKFVEIVAPAKLVTTERFEGAMDQGEALNVLALAEKKGGTILTLLMHFPSEAVRDAAIKSGMNDGIEAGFARLEKQQAPAALAT